jgi:catechol 2,3-dioxygenase-like lactoylglutathione lyase family enzyme
MRIDLASVMVSDQATALTFYTEVLGFVKQLDLPMGENRWLTVVSPEPPDDTQLLLEPMGFPPERWRLCIIPCPSASVRVHRGINAVASAPSHSFLRPGHQQHDPSDDRQHSGPSRDGLLLVGRDLHVADSEHITLGGEASSAEEDEGAEDDEDDSGDACWTHGFSDEE